MNKKYLLLTSLVLSTSAFAQTTDANQASQNPILQYYQTQVTNAQNSAAANVQKNYYPQAQATSFSSPISALNFIAGGINALVIYSYNTLTKVFYQMTYDVPQSIAANSSIATITGLSDTSAKMAGIAPYPTDATPSPPTLTGQTIFNTLTTLLPSNIYATFSDSSKIPVSMYSQAECSSATAVLKSAGQCYMASNKPQTFTSNLNMNSLLGPFPMGPNQQKLPQFSFAYPTGQTQIAQNYIQYAADMAQPLSLIDLAKCDATCMANPQIQQYIATIRTYAAQQSAGVSMLYRLLTERSLLTDPTTGQSVPLAQLAGLPQSTPNYPAASPLQVEEFAASRRLSDLNWFTSMESATGMTVARETLYVNAEMRFELFRLRMAIENLTAIAAVTQLQQLHASQSQIADLIPNQVKAIRANVKPYSQ